MAERLPIERVNELGLILEPFYAFDEVEIQAGELLSLVNEVLHHRSTQPVQEGGAWNFDMEAAPKDGTEVLVTLSIQAVTIGHVERVRNLERGHHDEWRDANGFPITPFAWMFMPAPATPAVEKDPEVSAK